jgi:hypothetical protein
LYDIANVFVSLGLIEKSKGTRSNKHTLNGSEKDPSFEWIGPPPLDIFHGIDHYSPLPDAPTSSSSSSSSSARSLSPATAGGGGGIFNTQLNQNSKCSRISEEGASYNGHTKKKKSMEGKEEEEYNNGDDEDNDLEGRDEDEDDKDDDDEEEDEDEDEESDLRDQLFKAPPTLTRVNGSIDSLSILTAATLSPYSLSQNDDLTPPNDSQHHYDQQQQGQIMGQGIILNEHMLPSSAPQQQQQQALQVVKLCEQNMGKMRFDETSDSLSPPLYTPISSYSSMHEIEPTAQRSCSDSSMRLPFISPPSARKSAVVSRGGGGGGGAHAIIAVQSDACMPLPSYNHLDNQHQQQSQHDQHHQHQNQKMPLIKKFKIQQDDDEWPAPYTMANNNTTTTTSLELPLPPNKMLEFQVERLRKFMDDYQDRWHQEHPSEDSPDMFDGLDTSVERNSHDDVTTAGGGGGRDGEWASKQQQQPHLHQNNIVLASDKSVPTNETFRKFSGVSTQDQATAGIIKNDIECEE